MSATTSTAAAAAVSRVDIKLRDGDVGFDCAEGDRVLYAGLAQGAALPYECATGTCGACKAKVIEGNVECAWPQAPAAQKLKTDKGEVLMCQSRVRGSLRLEVGKRMPPAPTPQPASFTATVAEHGLLTHDVALLRLALSRPLDFTAGQFCLLEAPGVVGFRAYSMVQAPSGGRSAEFIVKRKPGGVLTELLFSRALPSLVFRGFGPLGRAVFDPATDGDLLVMAGGTGMAGPMSVLEVASATGHLDRYSATVYFGVRAARDLFFLDRLSALKTRHPDRLQVVVAMSDEPVSTWDASLHPRLHFVHAMLHEAPQVLPPQPLTDPTAFLAGPPPAVEGCTRLVMTQLRLGPTKIKYDRFG